jgi:[ribosomal protein S5]-alanine N-acetyltransferase
MITESQLTDPNLQKVEAPVEVFPTLETERLLLREFTFEDAEDVFRIFSQEEVTRFHNLETMTSVSEAERLLAARIALYEHGLGVRWAITEKDHPEKAVGSCGLFSLNRAFRSAEVGYDLHPDFWNNGLVTEAVTAVLDYGYSHHFFYPLNRVEAVTDPAHYVSIHVLRKLGFTEEGIRREYGFWKGRFHDLRAFSLLRRDWVNRPKS